MRKTKQVKEEVDAKEVIKDLADAYGDSNETQGEMVTLQEEVRIGDYILEVGDVVKIIEAEPSIQEIIKDFIETDWSKSQESAGQAINLLKGLAFSDDPVAKKFINDLDKLSNTMEVSDYVSE
jgi:tRNA G37 N-methylase TrmD